MDKKLILLEHLAIAKTQITLNSKIDGVKLPPHLMGKDTVRLNLSNQLAIPTQFKTDKVVATLTFKGVPFECHIPYTSIYVIRLVNNIEDAVFFEESLPASTKRMVELFQNNGSLEALKFMAELENQFERDDVIVNINSDEKPQ
jgi:stringent starvation protein B